MADHPRTIIREKIGLILLDKTVAGRNVDTERVDPYRATEIPALAVFTPEEDVSEDSVNTAPRELNRTILLEIAAYPAPHKRVNKAMDAMALEVEQAIHDDPLLGGVADDAVLVKTELKYFNDGDRVLGCAVLSYAVTYRTLARAPQELDPFITADTKTEIVGITDPTQDAHDVVVLEQETP